MKFELIRGKLVENYFKGGGCGIKCFKCLQNVFSIFSGGSFFAESGSHCLISFPNYCIFKIAPVRSFVGQ